MLNLSEICDILRLYFHDSFIFFTKFDERVLYLLEGRTTTFSSSMQMFITLVFNSSPFFFTQ